MYFEIEDYRPDITPVGRAISWREGILLSIIFHLLVVILILLFPKYFHGDSAARVNALLAQQEHQDHPRFVFVAPQNDFTAPRARPRAEPSDKDRIARAPEPPKQPTNPLPFSRGNTPERVETPPVAAQQQPRTQTAQEPAPPGQQAQAQPEVRVPESQSPMAFNTPKEPAQNNTGKGRSGLGRGSILDSIQNAIPREVFENPGGNGGAEFGPLQFDTKGVEFGPWVRRFIQQVKRNWFVPYAAMSNKGHVVITFYVHKDGSLTNISVIGPSPIDPFNNAAFGALSGSNPTWPLPPEYPDEKAFFTVTFFYNETPP